MVRRRTGPSVFGILSLFVLILVVVVGGGYLLLGGEIPIPFTDPQVVLAFSKDGEKKRTPRPPGTILVPISTKEIAAFTKLSREHLWSGTASRWATVPMREESLSDQVIVNRKDILGRVLARDKPKGYIFTESDFLPRGTQPGVVAGIPVGKRGLRVEASKIAGLYGLRVGDRFDVLSTIALDGKSSGSPAASGFGGIYRQQMEMEQKLSGNTRQARVRVLAQNATVVSPVSTRRAPTTSTSLTQGVRTVTKPVQEVVIAVAPEEVAPLMEAFAVSAKLHCVPRSGRPGDSVESVTPDLTPRSPFWGPSGGDGSEGDGSRFRFVETVRGSSRTLIPVPNGRSTGGGGEERN